MINKTILLEAIYKKTGIYITTKNDCRFISQLILSEKVGTLSESTLYRFFLYKTEITKPYKNTYDVLAKFCGYPDWNTFLKYYDFNFLFNEPTFLNNSINIVIENYVINEKFDSLIDIFDTLETENYKTKEFYGVKTIINFQKTFLFPNFIKQFGHHHFVRNVIIEALFDPSHRIKGYEEGLENYIITTDKNSQNYYRDLIFAQSVLFRHYYLKSNQKAIEYGEKLYEDNNWETLVKEINIFPKTRFMVYKFWYISLKTNSKIQLINYSLFFMDWLKNEIENTSTIHELNIIYHTAKEVLQNLNLNEILNELKLMLEYKINFQNKNRIEFDKLYNPNGIINILN